MNFYSQYQDKLRVSNGVLGIDKEPIEVEEGWYLIPGYSRYLISKDYKLKDVKTPTREEVEKAEGIFKSYGLKLLEK